MNGQNSESNPNEAGVCNVHSWKEHQERFEMTARQPGLVKLFRGMNLGRRFVLPGRGLHFHELLELQLREITLVDLRVGSGSKVGVG